MTSLRKGRDLPDALVARKRFASFACQIIALAACLVTGSSALADTTTGGSGLIAQGAPVVPTVQAAPTSTILPTDVVPLPAAQERTSFGENLQLRVLQRLPAPFYFNFSYEGSVREETNVFQFPTKRKLLTQLNPNHNFFTLEQSQQAADLKTLNEAGAYDSIFRSLPSITWGWSLKPRTRVYGNYFMIRDQLAHWTQLNTVIHSIGYGVQQDVPIGRHANLQLDQQFRELYQLHSKPKFDFLPTWTLSYYPKPSLVLFLSTICQFRGKGYFRSPNVEIDPFYTWGGYFVKNGWSFSASNTFVQNFRQPFHSQATIPVNSYSMISDYEIARRLIRQLPGFQVFARAEPIWNFHSHAKPGLTGMDFRMYFGVRMAFGKPALTAAYEQIKQQLEEQETAPPPPGKTPGEAKPSAFLMPYQVTADNVQPIHGALSEDGSLPVVAVAFPGRPTYSSETTSAAETKIHAPIAATTPKRTTAVANAAPARVRAGAHAAAHAGAHAAAHSIARATAHAATPAAAPAVAANVSTDSTPEQEIPVLVGVRKNKAVKKSVELKAIAHTLPENQIASAIPASLAIKESIESVSAKTSELIANADSSSKDGGDDNATHSSRKKDKKKQVTKVTKQVERKPIATAMKSRDVQMVLVPPLPAVNTDSKENPFGNSGVDLKPPILLTPIR